MSGKRSHCTPKKRREWKPAFLSAFADTGMVTAACEAAGVARRTVYAARHADEAFAAAWDEIEERSTEDLEQVAVRRAREGSDTLLIFLLKSRRPGVYRENVRMEHTGAGGGPVELQAPPDATERSTRAALLLQRAGQTS
jgi:hypothetical protein